MLVRGHFQFQVEGHLRRVAAGCRSDQAPIRPIQQFHHLRTPGHASLALCGIVPSCEVEKSHSINTYNINHQSWGGLSTGDMCCSCWKNIIHIQLKSSFALPHFRSPLCQVENLTGIQKPLEFLQKFRALVASALWIYKNENWSDAWCWNRFDYESLKLLLLWLFLSRWLLFWCFP